MMIEMHHTIIADVAMSCALRSEDHAGLAEFEPVQLPVVYVQVEYSL